MTRNFNLAEEIRDQTLKLQKDARDLASSLVARAKSDPSAFIRQTLLLVFYVWVIWTYASKLYEPSASALTSLSRSVIFNGEQFNPSYYGAEVVTRRVSLLLLVFFLLAKNDLKSLNPREWEDWAVSASAVFVALSAPFLVVFFEPSPTTGLPLLLLGSPLLIGFALSTGDLTRLLEGGLEREPLIRSILPLFAFVLFCLLGTATLPFLTSDVPKTLTVMFTLIVLISFRNIGRGDSNPSEMDSRYSALAFIITSPLLLYFLTRMMFLTQNPDDAVSRRWEIDWSFMRNQNSFHFDTWPLEREFGAATRWDYYWAVILQSARATLLAIFLCTILGTFIGVLRLSSNKLASSMATFYVEMFRNFPLAILLFVIMTYFGQTLPLKGSADNWIFGSNPSGNGATGLAYISNSGSYFPLFEEWRVALFIAIMLSIWITFRYLQRDGVDDSNEALLRRSAIWGTGLILGLALVLGDYETPIMERLRADSAGTENPVPGTAFEITNPFFQLVLGLTLFTASVVAEIVRGSIQSLPHGQVEAAVSLGLSPYQRLRLVIMPQALRSMVPMLNSQYMNVWKNSSLAIVVSYPDIFQLIQIMMTNVGKLIPLFILLLVTYQAGSLTISVIMNFYNSRVTKVRI